MIRGDIDQTAWNLSGCNDDLQRKKFDNLVLETWEIGHNPAQNFLVKALFTVNASGTQFINEVIEEYMDGYVDYFDAALNGVYSRTGERVALNPHPPDWSFEVELSVQNEKNNKEG